MACKEWNEVPEDGLLWTGFSYDNTQALGASTWRHVMFLEQPATAGPQQVDMENPFRWIFLSDVCKHCVHSGCLEGCPTGAIVRTDVGSVLVQKDICNGCGYCVVSCPFGVVDKRHDDGRAFKCTFCYDRQSAGMMPACAKTCPTTSIKFGDHVDLVALARERVAELHEQGRTEARLYGANELDGVGGTGSVFLLLDEPEVYGLPPDPRVPTADLPRMYKMAGLAAGGMIAAAVLSFVKGRS